MGEVWKAHDRELDTPCAVKFILQHLAADRGIRDRFTREARAVARLRSPHVVQILGVGEVEDTPYLAMELLAGETLLARLDRLGKLDPFVTMKVVEQVGEALESAHQAGIVHRDLKPENIWFWAGNKVFIKVLDFGVAKTGLTTGSLQTATGALVGTPQYMSPEQALGNRDVDHRSDLWSLAVITVECLCGKRPFESEGLGDLLLKIVSNTPPSLNELAPELPAGLHEWWARALTRDPRGRFQSASELVDALRPHLVGNAPYSEVVHSGWPRSGLPSSGLPHSGWPQSGVPHSDQLSADRPFSGRQPSGREYEGDSQVPRPVVTVADGAGSPSEPVSRPQFPTEVQPRSAERSGQPPSDLRSGEPHSGQARSEAAPFGGFQPLSSPARSEQPSAVQPSAVQPSAVQPSTNAGVVSERAKRPSPGSVGPISSSRRPPARDGRHRNVVIAAALVTIGVVGTAWRMASDEEPRTMSPLPAAEAEATPPPASGPSTPPASTSKPPEPVKPAVAELRGAPPKSSPWDSALGNPKPGQTQTSVEALQPQPPPASVPPPAPSPAASSATDEPAAAAAPSAAAPPPRATPPRATAPRAVPPRATQPRAAPAPAAAPPARKASGISAADVGLSAPPPAKVNPAQSAAKAGSEGSGSAPSRGAGQADSDAERKEKLKRRIGLGSK
jgi:serine/threonine-protein kinase